MSIVKKKDKAKIDYRTLTSKEVEEELKRIKYNASYIKVLKSTVYALIIIVAISVLIATFFMPVFQISGKSMAPKYDNGDFVVSIKTSKLKSGDIIAFYHGNKILVKRVIAGAGQWVVIDKNGKVFIDGKEIDENYLTKKGLGDSDIKYPYHVPVDSWFVLSDDREETIDSRNSEIGCINNEDIIGKIIFKIWDSK